MDFTPSQMRKKVFQHLAQHAALLCFALEYTLLMLDEYWGNFPIAFLLIFLQMAFLSLAVNPKPAPRQALPFLLPIAATTVFMALVYTLLPGKDWLVASRVLGTCLFLMGALAWNRSWTGSVSSLLALYACALSLHLCYLPLPIVTAMFDIPPGWIWGYAAGAAASLLPALWVFTPVKKLKRCP